MGRYGLLLSALLSDIPFEKDFSLAAHTTVGVGGTVNAFLPQTARQLFSVVRLCERCNVRYFPLGAGSNVLASEEGYDGVILATDSFDRFAVEGNSLTAACGVGVGKLLGACKRYGLSGLEFLAGIPAKVGGLTYMNAGTQDGHIGDVVESVTCLQKDKIRTYRAEDCRFAYKDSAFQHFPCVILSVRFRLKECAAETVAENIARALEKRKDLPKGRSMGCVFKNPAPHISAGKLIDESGCKGWREGGAVVSERHANFILNDTDATAKDFRLLIGRVKRQVYLHTGVALQEEIRYIK